MGRGQNRGSSNNDARRTEAGRDSAARDEAVHRDPDIGGVTRRLASRDDQERADNHRDLRSRG